MLQGQGRAWSSVVALFVELAARRQAGDVDDELGRVARADLAAASIETRRGTGLASMLASRCDLTIEDELALWTLIVAQLDPDLAARLEGLGGSREVTCGALARVAFDRCPQRAVRMCSDASPLVELKLIELGDGRAWKRQVFASDRLLCIGLGDDGLEPQAGACMVTNPARLSLEGLAVDPSTVEEVRAAVRSGESSVVLVGLPNAGRATLLRAVADSLGVGLVEVDARKLTKEPGTLVDELRVIVREARLLGRTPLVTHVDAIVDHAVVARELVERLARPVLFTSSRAPDGLRGNRALVTIELKPLSARHRGRLWIDSLGSGSDTDAALLAARYPLVPGLIVRAATVARTRAEGQPLQSEHIEAAIRTVLDARLARFAKRIEVTQTWDDLVLADDHAATITELMARIRARDRVYEEWGFARKVGKGLGVAALFSGPPGTGKTMLAALIAKELGLELYQVDLGKLVSKWIGETEKQLGDLFDAAEAAHAVLLFDEADSLLGRRTEVRSSNDRYANLETNYILQRLESFTGICLFTTNHESNIDPAVHRRLSLHLRFQMPDEEERTRLWRAMLPATAPVDASINFGGLARRFELTGGYIRNAALRAAFLAADEDVPIAQAHLEHAARLEYEGMGKITLPHETFQRKLTTAS
ncbi:MAG: AAA family ATPase [Kofleriaceae bacterium]